jgi:hypothetical protein
MIQSPFIPDELYKRPLIHDVYGATDKMFNILNDIITFSNNFHGHLDKPL